MEQFIELVKFISGFSLLMLAGLGWTATKWIEVKRNDFKIGAAILLGITLVLILVSSYNLVWVLRDISFQALLNENDPNRNLASNEIKCAISTSIWTLISGTISLGLSLPCLTKKEGNE